MLQARWIRPVLLGMGLLCAGVASADTVYNYTGNNFNQFYGSTGDTTSNFLTITMTLASPLGANLSILSLTNITPISWSASDGTHSLDSNSAGLTTQFFFSTDGVGTITQWIINLSTPSVGLESYSPEATLSDGVQNVIINDVYIDRSVFGVDASSNTGAGVWTVSSTPEPTTWSLTMIPLAVMGWRWRRSRRSAARVL